ncbi:BnaC09g46930D [Brassica napus]|nr:BnaC09g46930D [Brassica napus]
MATSYTLLADLRVG